MTGLERAILGLRQAVDSPRRQHMWRWLVGHRIARVNEALGLEHSRDGDAWLAAREASLLRERDSLQRRLHRAGALLLEATDVDLLRRDLLRLLGDLEHHRQRLNDLVYDAVSLELGGSE